MPNKAFKKDELYADYDFKVDVVQDEIVDTSRWSVIHEIVFKYEDKFYSTTYSEGATEMQDESPFQYDEEIDCTEVHQVEKLVKVWEKV